MLAPVEGLAKLADEFELGLEPVGVVFLSSEHRFEEVPGAVVDLCDGRVPSRSTGR